MREHLRRRVGESGVAVWRAKWAEELHRILRGTTYVGAGRPTRLEARGDAAANGAEVPLGLSLERAALADVRPTTQQHDIGRRDLRGAHWLFRGVAGSGKSVMLALSAARTLYELTNDDDADLFAPAPTAGPDGATGEVDPMRPRVLVCCYNKTLVHFLRARVEERYGRLSYAEPPAGSLRVTHVDGLLKTLADAEPSLRSGRGFRERDARAADVAAALDALPADRRTALGYDADYLDEAQDLRPDEVRLLRRLCRPDARGRGTLVVFYDDAQNIYGAPRPVWADLGVEIVGRTTYLDACLRNTPQTLDLAFNVLVGSRAAEGERAETRTFADLAGLRQRGLVAERDGLFRVGFCRRPDGPNPTVDLHPTRDAEAAAVAGHVRRLVRDEGVLPNDVLVLAQSLSTFENLADRLRDAAGPNVAVKLVDESHRRNKDLPLTEDDVLTASTVHSSKG